jgi:hypothetical protein
MTGLPQDGTATPADSLPATFLAFLAKRELRIARLRASGKFVDFAEMSRVRSASDCDWVLASGRASLFSYVVYRRQYHPDFPVPYNVAAVVLEEGPLLISTIVSERREFSIDMPLMAAFDTTGRLIFKPTTERGTL